MNINNNESCINVILDYITDPHGENMINQIQQGNYIMARGYCSLITERATTPQEFTIANKIEDYLISKIEKDYDRGRI